MEILDKSGRPEQASCITCGQLLYELVPVSGANHLVLGRPRPEIANNCPITGRSHRTKATELLSSD